MCLEVQGFLSDLKACPTYRALLKQHADKKVMPHAKAIQM